MDEKICSKWYGIQGGGNGFFFFKISSVVIVYYWTPLDSGVSRYLSRCGLAKWLRWPSLDISFYNDLFFLTVFIDFGHGVCW